ncbi:serine/threonine-protein kinase HipA [Sanguibacter gelidistatuariae]|uniref:Serine/threonine-protein kinase HipA n=1 Tax=Sanguibacter gelidistatuariae TaxID=1814289 RepID=A0A1G6GUQ9_9MICO|nr:HipA domain-containing protein [Sanguibacter gelidistatuariae]SDB85719.1 serine/threonine-protein kinase HipA [Sanguibacter gelidistatuariae]
MTATLYVWLRGERLGELDKLRNGHLRLRFDPEILDTYGAGARPLSLSLPLTDKRVQGAHLERFLDNLLPEGSVRGALERQHQLHPGDTFGMLQSIGRECAGAIQLTPEDIAPGAGHLVPLSDGEVNQIVAQLPTLDPPPGQVVSASLGGVQAKVLLTRTEAGWAWPADGAMSTHLIKPEPTSDIVIPDLIRWEEWALRLARTAGLPAANAELADFDGRLALVVERFDRHDGKRAHQEDFTQALGVASRDKYETTRTEHRLAAIARAAGREAIAPATFLRDLLAQVTFNLIVGNGEAHSKNYSLAISHAATYAMAPLYDVAPVYLLNDAFQTFGHHLDGQGRLSYLTATHLRAEATTWGLADAAVCETIASVGSSVRQALSTCSADGIDVDRIGALIDARAVGALQVVS